MPLAGRLATVRWYLLWTLVLGVLQSGQAELTCTLTKTTSI